MANMSECPCCGADTYEFHYGAFEEGHRFGGSEPDTGYCSACGFHYEEHIKHPEKEQIERYKKTLEWNKFIINEMLPEATKNVNKDKPPIVCLCGSTRFMEEFLEWMWLYTLRGYIVLSVAVCKHEDVAKSSGHGGETISGDVANMLDKLHLHKIDLATEVFVINKDGYIGESTRKEIEYAKKQGKPVLYLEEPTEKK